LLEDCCLNTLPFDDICNDNEHEVLASYVANLIMFCDLIPL